MFQNESPSSSVAQENVETLLQTSENVLWIVDADYIFIIWVSLSFNVNDRFSPVYQDSFSSLSSWFVSTKTVLTNLCCGAFSSGMVHTESTQQRISKQTCQKAKIIGNRPCMLLLFMHLGWKKTMQVRERGCISFNILNFTTESTHNDFTFCLSVRNKCT